MRVIFLDIDGVVTSRQSHFLHEHYLNAAEKRNCPISLANLEKILHEIPDARIVISSSWRIEHELPELRKMLTAEIAEREGEKYLVRGGITDPTRIIGATPKIVIQEGRWLEGRGYEIQAWIDANRNEIKDFVIVDDEENNAAPLTGYLFQTDPEIGLDRHAAENIIRYFKSNPVRRKIIRFSNYVDIMLRIQYGRFKNYRNLIKSRFRSGGKVQWGK